MSLVRLFKQPAESRLYTFEFADQVEIADAGESLTGTPTITVTLLSGSGSLTVGSPTISGTKVQVQISGGTAEDRFQVVCQVNTSGSHVLECTGELRIKRLT